MGQQAIRKQYHFRLSDDGKLLAWDVIKLIEKTKNLRPKVVKISSIKEFNECYWYDLGGAKPTCANFVEHMKLVKKANLSYPIILCNKARIMDGMHRVCKASLLGLDEISAYQFEEYIQPDFIDISPEELQY